MLKGGDARVTIPTIALAEIDSDVNMTAEEKLLKYFDNIEDDVDLLYEILPAIYIARQLYYLPHQTVQRSRVTRLSIRDRHLHQYAENSETDTEEDWVQTDEENVEVEEGAVDEKTLLLLVGEDVELANTLAKSLRIQGKEQPAKFEKSPIEATTKLFEAEIHTLEKWRTDRGNRITNEMVSILRRQTEVFRGMVNCPKIKIPANNNLPAMDNAALDKLDARDVRELVESFQNNYKLLQQLSTDREISTADSKKGARFKATEAADRLEKLPAM